MLLASRASSGPPALVPPRCAVLRRGRGPWTGDERCGDDDGRGGAFAADYVAAADALADAGELYRSIEVPPEAHVVPQAALEAAARAIAGAFGGGANASTTSTDAAPAPAPGATPGAARRLAQDAAAPPAPAPAVAPAAPPDAPPAPPVAPPPAPSPQAPAPPAPAAPPAPVYERGYYIAVYLPPSAAGGPASAAFRLRASLRPAAALSASAPPCPFDCMGRASACVPPPPAEQRMAAGGATPLLPGTCVCAGSDLNASALGGASSSSSEAAAAAAPAPAPPAPADGVFAGSFCEAPADALPANGTLSGGVAVGGWSYSYMDLPSAGAAALDLQVAAPGAGAGADVAAAALPPPALFVRRGAPPRATPIIYGAAAEHVDVALGMAATSSSSSTSSSSETSDDDSAPTQPPDAAATHAARRGGGASRGALGARGNVRVSLTGAFPPGARISQARACVLALLRCCSVVHVLTPFPGAACSDFVPGSGAQRQQP